MALFGIIMCKFLQVLFEYVALICNQNNRFTPEWSVHKHPGYLLSAGCINSSRYISSTNSPSGDWGWISRPWPLMSDVVEGLDALPMMRVFDTIWAIEDRLRSTFKQNAVYDLWKIYYTCDKKSTKHGLC